MKIKNFDVLKFCKICESQQERLFIEELAYSSHQIEESEILKKLKKHKNLKQICCIQINKTSLKHLLVEKFVLKFKFKTSSEFFKCVSNALILKLITLKDLQIVLDSNLLDNDNSEQCDVFPEEHQSISKAIHLISKQFPNFLQLLQCLPK